MRKLHSAALSAAALVAAFAGSSARADTIGFNGVFAPGNWTLVDTPGTLLPSTLPVFTATTLTITGQDDETGQSGCALTANPINPCTVGERITLPGPMSFTIGWSYTSMDLGAAFDFFEAVVDGVVVPLSDVGNASTTSGTKTFTANNSLEFIVDCTDCTGGALTGTITSFAAVTALGVPEPAVMALFGLGALAFGVSRRRRPAILAPFAAA